MIEAEGRGPAPTTLEARGRQDDGLLGPDSVAWQVVSHPIALVGGLRSLIIQALHPLAMAAVAEHSDYRRHPIERLQRTAYYVAAAAIGDTATATAAAERVKQVHRIIHGTDPVTGQPYSAEDPETQLWVHMAEWHSFLTAYRTYVQPLSRADQDRYMAEGAKVAALLEVPIDAVPSSIEEARAYFAAVRPQLRVSSTALETINFVIHPPFRRDAAFIYLPMRQFATAALAIVPRELRDFIGIDRVSAFDPVAVASMRPAARALALPPMRLTHQLVVGPKTAALTSYAARQVAQRQRRAAA